MTFLISKICPFDFANQMGKYWKSKITFEIKRTHFGNQKIISEIKWTNFGNQSIVSAIKRATDFGNQEIVSEIKRTILEIKKLI